MTDNPVAQILLQVLEQADKGKFRYPLHITIETADGEKAVYEFPAPGENPTLIHSTLDLDNVGIVFPVTLVARDATQPHKELHARIMADVEGENAARITMEMEEEEESPAALFERRRSTEDLIRELDEESFFHNVVMLVVGFENTTVFVKSTDPQRLKVLNDAVRVGGNPIGLIAADMEGGHLTISRKIFPENAERAEQCEAYFDKLIGELGETLKAEIENRSRHPEGEQG